VGMIVGLAKTCLLLPNRSFISEVFCVNCCRHITQGINGTTIKKEIPTTWKIHTKFAAIIISFSFLIFLPYNLLNLMMNEQDV
jgi:hypothetical protein